MNTLHPTNLEIVHFWLLVGHLEQLGLEREVGATLHPTPYTLLPSPYTLHPSPYTLHPTPYTLHPSPNTLHPTP